MKYLQEAKEFLRKNELSLTIREAIPQTPPLWINEDKNEDYGIKYWVELLNRKNGEKYGFSFWNSINAKMKNERPNAYDVLKFMGYLSHLALIHIRTGRVFRTFVRGLIMKQTAEKRKRFIKPL